VLHIRKGGDGAQRRTDSHEAQRQHLRREGGREGGKEGGVRARTKKKKARGKEEGKRMDRNRLHNKGDVAGPSISDVNIFLPPSLPA